MEDDKMVDEVMKQKSDMKEVFVLDLDGIFQEGYEGGCYPEKDLDGRGHYGTCLLEDKEKYKKRFLLEMATRFETFGTIESRE